MGIIRELPREMIERIAAGEVVERPSSVVKELVENSIDAGAKNIVVDIEDGGKKRIAVIDDGCGMDAKDLSMSVLRHATSKLNDEMDLWNIRTMGFRGEALAAMGAVSRLTIETKPNSADVIEGAKIDVTGGVANGPSSVGCPGGTKVVISDIFFNVPARLKFLRSGPIEQGHVFDVIANLALASPEIRFEFSADGKRRFISGGGPSPRQGGYGPASGVWERVVDVIGEDVRDRLISFEEVGDGIAVRGWIADGGKSGGKDIYFFMNRRPVRDKILMHALIQGFGERLSRGEYPVAVVWLDIDPAKVDVNVHPAKREVRFANGGAVHDFVMAAVRKTVAQLPSLAARSSQLAKPTPTDERRATSDGSLTSDERRKFDERRATSDESRATNDERRATSDGFRVLGQLGLTYVVCEGDDDELVLIDQHAAHERLKFDSLKRQYAEGRIAQQRLLIPERVELGEKALAYVSERGEFFTRMGFEIEPFGGATLLVKAVPSVLGDASVASLFDKIASELENFGGSSSHDEEVEHVFATVACHSQVRGGDKLSNDELSSLTRDITREGVTHCPHGRPVVVRIEKWEIEKWFKRRPS